MELKGILLQCKLLLPIIVQKICSSRTAAKHQKNCQKRAQNSLARAALLLLLLGLLLDVIRIRRLGILGSLVNIRRIRKGRLLAPGTGIVVERRLLAVSRQLARILLRLFIFRLRTGVDVIIILFILLFIVTFGTTTFVDEFSEDSSNDESSKLSENSFLPFRFQCAL